MKGLKMRIVMAAVVCVCLAACGGKGSTANAETPEAAVKSAMEALQALDLGTFNACTDNYVSTDRNWLGIPVERRYRVFNELQQPGILQGAKERSNQAFAEKMVENLSWEIIGETTEGGQSVITLRITNTDMSNVMGYYTVHILEKMAGGRGTGLKELFEEIAESDYDRGGVLPFLDEAEGSVTTDVAVTVCRENNRWIMKITDPFIEAFMGNFGTGEFSDEVKERIDELETEYEKKMDQWGEDFGSRIEQWVEGIFD